MSRYKFKQLLKVKTAKCMGVDIFKNLLIVGLGSFLGGGARYLVSVAMSNIGKAFPWGTLTVNLVGCFVIGLLCGILVVPLTMGERLLYSVRLAFVAVLRRSQPSQRRLF